VNSDPLLKPYGSLEGIADMLQRGKDLIAYKYKSWPIDLPVLFLHGEADTVTLWTSTKEYHDELPASDKQFIAFPDMMHALNAEPSLKERFIGDILNWIEAHIPH